MTLIIISRMLSTIRKANKEVVLYSLLFTKKLLKVSRLCKYRIFIYYFSFSNFLLLTLSIVIPTISPFSYLIIISSSVSSESSA